MFSGRREFIYLVETLEGYYERNVYCCFRNYSARFGFDECYYKEIFLTLRKKNTLKQKYVAKCTPKKKQIEEKVLNDSGYNPVPEKTSSLNLYMAELRDYMDVLYKEKRDEYQKRLNTYFSSPESRMFEKNVDSPWAISGELCEEAMNKTNELLGFTEEKGEAAFCTARRKSFSDLTVSPVRFLYVEISKLADGKSMFYHSKEEERLVRFGEDKELSSHLFDAWTDFLELVTEAVKRNWRPMVHIDGKRGEYNDILYYDEELNLMVRYEPDDNYYHWGGYEHCVGVPTKGQSYYDREKKIRYIHCPEEFDSIEYDWSETNEKRYRAWDRDEKDVFSGWRK